MRTAGREPACADHHRPAGARPSPAGTVTRTPRAVGTPRARAVEPVPSSRAPSTDSLAAGSRRCGATRARVDQNRPMSAALAEHRDFLPGNSPRCGSGGADTTHGARPHGLASRRVRHRRACVDGPNCPCLSGKRRPSPRAIPVPAHGVRRLTVQDDERTGWQRCDLVRTICSRGGPHPPTGLLLLRAARPGARAGPSGGGCVPGGPSLRRAAVHHVVKNFPPAVRTARTTTTGMSGGTPNSSVATPCSATTHPDLTRRP